MSANQRVRINPASKGSQSSESGMMNERILLLLFESLKWDLHTVCMTASVNRKLRALAKRVLWREMCLYRAPRMVSTLVNGSHNGRIDGGWHALAKVMFYCCGYQSTRHFKASQSVPGHFVKASRFSKTSGRSFLTKRCRSDLLYVTDPCEHPIGEHEDDLGVYRGVFQGFMRSRTRECLIRKQVDLEQEVRCPYCGARVWSMTTARLVPKSAARRLGSHEGGLEFFVCLNGHLHGACWLVPLSSDDNHDHGDDVDDDDDDAADVDHSDDQVNQTVASGSLSSAAETERHHL